MTLVKSQGCCREEKMSIFLVAGIEETVSVFVSMWSFKPGSGQ